MANLDFTGVQTLLLEEEASVRLIRSALATMGFRNVAKGDPTAPDLAALDFGAFDLIVVHATLEEPAGLELIQQIRNRRFRTNPFVCALVTAWSPTPALIARAGLVGADGVLAKPFSMNAIRASVSKCVDMPRPWIAAPGYVGPDRRRDRPPNPDDPVVAVPNVLRMKALGQMVGDIADRIDHAWAAVATMRLDRTVRTAGEILRQTRGDPGAPGTGEMIARVAEMMEDLVRRAGPTDPPEAPRIAGEAAAILREALRTRQDLPGALSASIRLADRLADVAGIPRPAAA